MSPKDSRFLDLLYEVILENPWYTHAEAETEARKRLKKEAKREADFPLVVYLWPREMVA